MESGWKQDGKASHKLSTGRENFLLPSTGIHFFPQVEFSGNRGLMGGKSVCKLFSAGTVTGGKKCSSGGNKLFYSGNMGYTSMLPEGNEWMQIGKLVYSSGKGGTILMHLSHTTSSCKPLDCLTGVLSSSNADLTV